MPMDYHTATYGLPYKNGMPIPTKRAISQTQRILAATAKRQGVTAYALAQKTGLAINSAQRFLAGQGSPTIATVEAVAAALGLRITVEPVK